MAKHSELTSDAISNVKQRTKRVCARTVHTVAAVVCCILTFFRDLNKLSVLELELVINHEFTIGRDIRHKIPFDSHKKLRRADGGVVTCNCLSHAIRPNAWARAAMRALRMSASEKFNAARTSCSSVAIGRTDLQPKHGSSRLTEKGTLLSRMRPMAAMLPSPLAVVGHASMCTPRARMASRMVALVVAAYA